MQRKKSKNQGAVQYSFLGHANRAAGYASIFCAVLEELAKKDPSVLDRLEKLFEDRNTQISRTREDVYSPDRAKSLVDGWWVNTQLTRERTIHNLSVACREANIPFGEKSGLWLEGMEKYQLGKPEYDQEPSAPAISKNLGSVLYSFLGVEGKAAGYSTVHYEVLEKLHEQDPTLLGRLEKLLVETHTQVSRKRNAVHHPERAKQVAGSWWVNRQLNRDRVIDILTMACREANIPFGEKSGLWIEGMEKFQSDHNEQGAHTGQGTKVKHKKKSKNYGAVMYSFLGVEGRARGYKTVYDMVVDKLTEKDTSILERTENIVVEHYVYKRKPTKTVKQFSRNREEVHWHERARPFKDGWWINTQWGREGFINILTVLCLAANIPFGKKSGLWLEGMEKFQTGKLPYDISSLNKPK